MMKSGFWFSVAAGAVASLTLLPWLLPAQEGAGFNLSGRFKEYDRNGDGKLTAEELPAALMKRLDLDGDGEVPMDEARAALSSQAASGIIEKAAKKADKNGDGLVSREEAGNAKWFSRVDANRDGQLDPQELAQASAFLQTILGGGASTPPDPAVEPPQPVIQGPTRLTPAEGGIGRQVADAAFTTMDGTKSSLAELAAPGGLIIAYTSTTCPVSKRYAASLARLSNELPDKGVKMLLVNPFKSESDEDIRSDIAARAFACAYAADRTDALGPVLGARSTTEVFLLDATRTLIYRGALDDQYGIGYNLDAPRQRFAEDAVAAMLAGRRPPVEATVAPGCELEHEAGREPSVTRLGYHRDVARILQQNCVECHREGGLAPFSLEDPQEVLDRARTIHRVVSEGTMPPWFAAPPEKGASPWANDRSLSARDKADLLAWVASPDKPMGRASDAPRPARYPEGGWAQGEPDLIVELPKTVPIKAEGKMPYVNLTVPTGLTGDRWVRGYEIQPTARSVVHHVLTWVVDEDKERKFDEFGGFFAAYVPGNAWQMFPEGFAKKVPAGSSVRFQLHYTPSGEATEDRTRIGFYFAKEKPRYEVQVTSVATNKFAIPPGAPNHEVTATRTVPSDVTLLAFMPHMHLRGKAFRYEIARPDGTIPLLDVPRYDFNWQLSYRLKEPLFLPRGTQVRAVAHFDNSAGNPANPDPAKTVKWGQQSDEEMMLGYVEYYVPIEQRMPDAK